MNDGDDHHIPSLQLQKLKVVSALGRGAKGVVFLVQTESGELLALKAILRHSIDKNKGNGNSDDSEYRRVCFEQEVLKCFRHPLLPKLHGVVVTEKIVGYAIDYCPGRDLNSLRKKQTEKMFSDDITRFYAAELVLALEYLHSLGIVYRDLKPENVMIQENGHLMLVDFDLSTKLCSAKTPESPPIVEPVPKSGPVKKKNVAAFYRCCSSGISPEDTVSVPPAELGANSRTSTSESDSVEKSNSFVGTEEYVAPEIILGTGHDFAVDCWCLGVVLYEMLYGTTPFRGSNRKETFHRILKKSPELVGEPTALRDLIGKLLEKDPKQRISLEKVKVHDFFKGVDWNLILRIQRPPCIPVRPEDKGIEGNKGIDVEDFVHEIFKAVEEEKEEENKDSEKKSNDESRNNGVWVEEQNYPTRGDNFLSF
ncbi:unnamed protein product [Ilex paraguariensis]|uniref:non-specific serine/threonine protein kinase n=1 Tax=Ilex paraguariensis TaxID=185542 RepID=A0ABC8V5Q0_9AQUA